jgi:hypothetical protein
MKTKKESKANVVFVCDDCIKEMYPNMGTYDEANTPAAGHVKKRFGTEHMWVTIEERSPGGVWGRVDNIPYNEDAPDLGTWTFVTYPEIETVHDAHALR